LQQALYTLMSLTNHYNHIRCDVIGMTSVNFAAVLKRKSNLLKGYACLQLEQYVHVMWKGKRTVAVCVCMRVWQRGETVQFTVRTTEPTATYWYQVLDTAVICHIIKALQMSLSLLCFILSFVYVCHGW